MAKKASSGAAALPSGELGPLHVPLNLGGPKPMPVNTLGLSKFRDHEVSTESRDIIARIRLYRPYDPSLTESELEIKVRDSGTGALMDAVESAGRVQLNEDEISKWLVTLYQAIRSASGMTYICAGTLSFLACAILRAKHPGKGDVIVNQVGSAFGMAMNGYFSSADSSKEEDVTVVRTVIPVTEKGVSVLFDSGADSAPNASLIAPPTEYIRAFGWPGQTPIRLTEFGKRVERETSDGTVQSTKVRRRGQYRLSARELADAIEGGEVEGRALKEKWDRRRKFYPPPRGKRGKQTHLYALDELLQRAITWGDTTEHRRRHVMNYLRLGK